MRTNVKKKLHRLTALTAITVAALSCFSKANAERTEIDRYKVDFIYQGVHYNILSESEKTVAVAQPYDIDYAGTPGSSRIAPYLRDNVDSNGFMMGDGLMGPVVVIPSTVYDAQGNAYTVTDIADYAINWVGMTNLILPPTLKDINHGIGSVFGLTTLYLPEGLTEIAGISNCHDLKNLQIPWNTKAIRKYSLYNIGLEYAYLPPAVQTLDDFVLASCDSLRLAMISGVETMGSGCFSECKSFQWANLPESLKSMGEGCFNDCPSLELVSLPWSEIKMEGCFNGCPAIDRIEVLAVEPNPFPSGSFLDVDRTTCELAVPAGSEDRYRQADGWKEFLNIVGDIPAVTGTDVAPLPSTDFRAFGVKGAVRIINSSGLQLDIFDLGGNKVASVSREGISEIPLPQGVYIVGSPHGSGKVTVK